MVAIIKTGHAIRNILNYNENKVKAGCAQCIGQGNYPVDADRLSFTMKLNRFVKVLQLNENVKRNSVHISLNFDPSEKEISNEKLCAVAESYMQKIGFGQQPYLIYRHHDSGHPHIHLVSVNIQRDGSRIDMHHLGIRKSEPARKEIEETFGMVRAQGRRQKEDFPIRPVAMGKVRYGRIESKKAITAVLEGVLPEYKYCSLPELNAVLRQYNILADRGSEKSRVFRGRGLVYRILGEDGMPVGVPIKASDFYNKPTLAALEEKFIANEPSRLPHKARIKNAVGLALLGGKATSITGLAAAMEKEGITMVLRQSPDGLVYGITYVDHRTKCVFNGSALGKQYSAKAIRERCDGIKPELSKDSNTSAEKQRQATENPRGQSSGSGAIDGAAPLTGAVPVNKVIDMLMTPENTFDYLPGQLKGRKKKKRKKGK